MLPAPSGLGPLGVAALIIAALYVGREVFVPVALAILLSFVLAPAISPVRERSLVTATVTGTRGPHHQVPVISGEVSRYLGKALPTTEPSAARS